ncbi:MAG: DUF2298 domain-containing protein, partial [Chloroflexi bacterium]|nr:DUF2298 domain-containing protein [Chloroflexota bacterium]
MRSPIEAGGTEAGWRVRDLWLLLPILAVALALRLYGLGWDDGHLFHPDERHIIMTANNLVLPMPPNWGLLLSPQSPPNPHFFAYGSFPFYLLRLVAHILASHGWWMPGLESWRVLSDFDHLRLVGRVISALFDTGSLVLIFLLGRKLYSRRVGLLAAALLGLTVLNIQLSHFFAFDTIVTFFMLASTLAALKLAEQGTVRSALLLGLCVGLALATKISAGPILAAVAAALVLHLIMRRRDENGEYEVRLLTREAGGVEVQVLTREPSFFDVRLPRLTDVNRAVGLGMVALLTITAVFVITEPYALIDFPTFVRNMAEQSGMVQGTADLPYTRQYANTPPYWYFVQNLLAWGMGWPLALAAFAGTVAALWRAARRPLPGELVILAWVVPYFLITGAFHAKFLRYILPVVPFLCLFGAYGLSALWMACRRQASPQLVPAVSSTGDIGGGASTGLVTGESFDAWPGRGGNGPTPSSPLARWWQEIVNRGWAEVAAGAVIAIVVLWGLFYSLAYIRIYSVDHTGVQASRWMYDNIPDGSRLAREHWEEGLPVNISAPPVTHSPDSHHYQFTELPLYENDDARKLNTIIQVLSSSDYIIFFSNRLYATIPRLPQRYPITTRYYHLLFSQQLGYDLVAAFTSYPNLLGVTFMDDTFSDEGLQPPPLLSNFRPSPIVINNGKADESFTVYDHPKVMIFKKVRNLSRQDMEALFAGIVPVGPQASRPEGLLLTPARQQAMAAGGTFRELFQTDSLANRFPWLVWMVMIEALGLLAFPIAFVAFRTLPDRGYLLSKILGILLVTWVSWMLVSLGLLPNTRPTVVIAILLVAILSTYLAFRYSAPIKGFWRENRRAVLWGEALFWVAFLFFLGIRLANPDLWHPARGGEKPMDLAYLMGAIKSVQFPPYDPWFAGGYLNYYYYGQIIVATLVKFSGVLPVMAYNLTVPTLYALTAGGAFSLAYNLSSPGSSRWWRPFVAGGLAAVFLALIGNLATAAQLMEQLRRNAGPLDIRSTLPGVEGAVRAGTGLWATLFLGRPFPIPTDWYWASSRVYTGVAVVNEFPYFTFLYADLHAHMIAFPFALLALGAAVNALKGRARDGADGLADGPAVPPARRWRDWGRLFDWEGLLGLAVAALAIGVLAPVNSWDFPTYLAIFGLALLIARYTGLTRSEGRLSIGILLGPVVVQFGLVAALAYLLYYPSSSFPSL